MPSANKVTKKASVALFLLFAGTTNTEARTNGRHLPSWGSALQEAVGDVDALKDSEADYAQSVSDAALAAHEENDFLSDSTMEQIHVITRHGARSMLAKDSDTLAEQGGATLTPLGQQQLYELGDWLRTNYKGLLGRGKSLDYFNPSLHRFESTNLDRTLTSANALAMGLFPSKTRATGIHKTDPLNTAYNSTMLFDSPLEFAPAIPVYTDGNDYNDVTLRAYKNCPTFMNRLKNELYTSVEWKNLEELHEELLTKLGGIFPEMAVDGSMPLEKIWNAYDPIHVARTECASTEDTCLAFVTHEHLAEALSTSEFETLERLTEHVEHLKFGYGKDAANTKEVVTAGDLLGSNLLWKILNRAKGDGNFFLYSAHAPTLLGFLSTLQATDDFYGASGGQKFVDYGAALIVEIHKSTNKGKYFFVLRYKASGRDDADSVVLKESSTGIKCGQNLGPLSNIPKAAWCSLDEVIVWAKDNTLTNQRDWCKACGNTLADVCITGVNAYDQFSEKKNSYTLKQDGAMAWMESSELFGYDESAQSTLVICGLFFGGFFAGILLMGLMWCFGSRYCCQPTSGKSLDTTVPVSDDNEGVFTNDFDESNLTAEQLNNKDIC